MSKDYRIRELRATCHAAAQACRDAGPILAETADHLDAAGDLLVEQAERIAKQAATIAEISTPWAGNLTRAEIAAFFDFGRWITGSEGDDLAELMRRLSSPAFSRAVEQLTGRAPTTPGMVDSERYTAILADSALAECDKCGAPVSLMDSGWRWNDESWEHKCPGSDPQAGHVGRPVPRADVPPAECPRCGRAVETSHWSRDGEFWRHECLVDAGHAVHGLVYAGPRATERLGAEDLEQRDAEPTAPELAALLGAAAACGNLLAADRRSASVADLMPIVYALGVAEDPGYQNGPLWTALRLLAPDLYAECGAGDAGEALDRWMTANEQVAIAEGFR